MFFSLKFNPPENYSVPSKKPASAASDPKSKSVGAKKTATRPASGARAVSKPAPVSNGKRLVSVFEV